jgi:D-beta-D-heptose 7-phosphate kinase/D-beta-D-heptose 1-phosphate adenosyltransferase
MKVKPKLIFVNGCFDILHPGHIKLFEHARSLGDELIVAIDCDKRVKDMKGETRPFNNQTTRKIILKSIKYIDEVYIFNSEEQLEEIVKNLKPDIMMVGSDWKGKKIVGSDYAKEVQFFDRIPGYSTTETIKRFTNR